MSRTVHKKKYRFSERKKFREIKRRASKRVRQGNETNFAVLAKLKEVVFNWNRPMKRKPKR